VALASHLAASEELMSAIWEYCVLPSSIDPAAAAAEETTELILEASCPSEVEKEGGNH